MPSEKLSWRWIQLRETFFFRNLLRVRMHEKWKFKQDVMTYRHVGRTVPQTSFDILGAWKSFKICFYLALSSFLFERRIRNTEMHDVKNNTCIIMQPHSLYLIEIKESKAYRGFGLQLLIWLFYKKQGNDKIRKRKQKRGNRQREKKTETNKQQTLITIQLSTRTIHINKHPRSTYIETSMQYLNLYITH